MSDRLVIAFGPVAHDFGSWSWIGGDLSQALKDVVTTVTFESSVPECDAVVFVKFKPCSSELASLSQRCALVYCPVDLYGSASQIDQDESALRHCQTIVVHCERLRRYFSAYATVEYLDHHLKYLTPLSTEQNTSGPILWIGNHSNLPPVVNWVNQTPLPTELWILTDSLQSSTSPEELGFRPGVVTRIGHWTPQQHIAWTSLARAAMDIKGDNFRARHKPPAKALDFLASGLPLAMNADASPVEHLAHLGFSIPDPADTDRWLSEDYWTATQQLALQLRRDLTLSQVASRLFHIVKQAIDAHVEG